MPALTFLHLSDLQFGKHHLFEAEGVRGDKAWDTLFERLGDDLAKLRDETKLIPDVIVLTGDLVEEGKWGEFEQVLDFARKLQDFYELARRRILVVPGNHDISRTLCRNYFGSCEVYGDTPERPYWPKWETYSRFFSEFYKGVDDYRFTEDQPYTLFELPELKLIVAGLNSTIQESHQENDHYGLVGEAQLRWFADKLRSRSDWVRVAAVHHNVVRKAVNDEENLRDADLMKRSLKDHLHLVLHGHQHEAKSEWWGPRTPILSTGSAAVGPHARPLDVPCQYQFVRLSDGGLHWWTRMYARSERRFVADPRHAADGESWGHHEEIDLKVAVLAKTRTSKTREVEVSDAAPRIPHFGEDPRGQRSRRLSAPRDGIFARIAEIIRIRESTSDIEYVPDDKLGHFLRVTKMDEYGITRQGVYGVIAGAVTKEWVDAFLTRVVKPMRRVDSIDAYIIHCREAPTPGLIRYVRSELVEIMSLATYRGEPELRPTVEALVREIENNQHYPLEHYVPQRVSLSPGGETLKDNAVDEISRLLSTTRGSLVLILGDFGVGKTFLMRQLAHRLGTAHLRDGTPLLPIYIRMGELDRTHGLDQMIGAALSEHDSRLVRAQLERGEIVLLFDGFDELVLRVSYERAAEHLDAVIQAASGSAKVVVSSRTQHFISDEQATEMFNRVKSTGKLHAVRLQPFLDAQIREFLRRKLGESEGRERYELMTKIHDLVGLSENPRLLSFIARLAPEKLEAAHSRGRGGTITQAEIYRMLVNDWLSLEHKLAHPKGSTLGLSVEACYRAVTQVGVTLWRKGIACVSLQELTESVGDVLREFLEVSATTFGDDEAVHAVGARTLLTRDAKGRFAFVHQSVMEWFVARWIADAIAEGRDHLCLGEASLSSLMIDFIADLADAERLPRWLDLASTGEGATSKLNVRELRQRLGLTNTPLVLKGQDLRGWSLGSALRGADLSDSNLSGMNLEGADFREATLVRTNFDAAILNRAKFAGADLTEASLVGARLLYAELGGALLRGTNLSRAALLGAMGALDDVEHRLGMAAPNSLDRAKLRMSLGGGGGSPVSYSAPIGRSSRSLPGR